MTFSYLWGGNEAKVIETLIAKFNSSQDRITVKGVSNPDAAAQLASMTGSKGQFDISDHFCGSVSGWVKQGLLEDLSTYIQKESYDLSDFTEQSMKPVTVDGKQYSMPIVGYTYQLIYNKKLLSEAGVQPPKTWSEFVEAGKKLTVVKDGKVQRLGYAPQSLIFTTHGMGGDFSKDGKPYLDIEKATAAANMWLDETQGIDPAALKAYLGSFGDYWSAENPFYAGKVAMSLDGPWHVQMIPNFKPDLQWGAVPLPVTAAGAQPIATSDCSTLFIPRNAPHKAEAWEFMKFMLANDNMATFSKALVNVPTRKSVAKDPQLAALGPEFKVWLDAPSTQVIKPAMSETWAAKYGTDLGAAVDAINNRSQTPAQAFAKLQEQIKGY